MKNDPIIPPFRVNDAGELVVHPTYRDIFEHVAEMVSEGHHPLVIAMALTKLTNVILETIYEKGQPQ